MLAVKKIPGPWYIVNEAEGICVLAGLLNAP